MLQLFNKKLTRIGFAVRFGFALGVLTAFPSLGLLAILWFSAISMARLADAGKPRWIGAWHVVAMLVVSTITAATGNNPIAPNTIGLKIFVGFFFLFHCVLLIFPSTSEGASKVNLWRAMFLSKGQRKQLSAGAASTLKILTESQPAREAWMVEVGRLTEMSKNLTAFQQSMSTPSTPEERTQFEKLIAAMKVQQAVCDDHRKLNQPATDAMQASAASLNDRMQRLGVIRQEAA
jgi:hypothetical protein